MRIWIMAVMNGFINEAKFCQTLEELGVYIEIVDELTRLFIAASPEYVEKS